MIGVRDNFPGRGVSNQLTMDATREELESQEMASAGVTARAIWLLGVQVLALLVLVVMLAWAGGAYDALPTADGGTAWSQALRQLVAFVFQPQRLAAPATVPQQLLMLLTAVLLAIAVIPPLRRGAWAGMFCGITLAVACQLAAGVTFSLGDPGDVGLAASYVPVAAPLVVGAAVAAALWGLLARARLIGTARFGLAALAGGVLLLLGFLILVGLINGPAFHALYAPIKPYQIAEMLAVLTLYPAALWLGSTGVRTTGGLRILPLGMVIVLTGFLTYWHVR